ncbi:MAG: c-type cytochrome biogenesis protein CcsB [Candidatus Aminicenantes bacterium]|nr:c-type cytochrome biogenesis protein CcsB [Candidatus Aminicenantes bacterium]
MTEPKMFLAAFILYILAAVLYLFFLFLKKENAARNGYVLAAAGAVLHTLALILRVFVIGHAPFTNMYESLSFLAWASIAAYLVLERAFAIRKIGPFLLLLVIALMALASSPLMPKEAAPLVPALQSHWLWLHVSVTLIGEAFFAVGTLTSLLYLAAERRERKGMARKGGHDEKDSAHYDTVSYRVIAIGFPLFTLGGLVFGMVWASKAWGSYWSWDPKEVWTLITWFIYGLYLHTRIVMGWKGRRSALIAVIAFLAALFTFFGVNYLLSGLHSYA